ncbi:MAG: ABC transporter permease [Chloroflexi bacterium]|nr:ABC transporter permease [Chloroflexota bacterium]
MSAVMSANPFARRLLSTLWWDVRLQFRNGFYYAVAFVLVFWVVLVSQLRMLDWALLLPLLMLGNLIISTFYFIGGLVLLEKGEGTLEAQIVTPLRTWEYLTSKVISLTLLTLIENLVIALVTYGPGFAVLPLLLGVAAASAFYVLAGFVAVAGYDSINEYLFPSLPYALFFMLPALDYLGIWKSGLFYLHPLQAPLLLMQAAFRPVEAGQWIYALSYSLVWIGVVYVLSRRAFHRFIIAKEGVK